MAPRGYYRQVYSEHVHSSHLKIYCILSINVFVLVRFLKQNNVLYYVGRIVALHRSVDFVNNS